MWRRYRSRVLIACSAQLFAQFVSSGWSISSPLRKPPDLLTPVFFFLSGGNCRTESTCTSFLSVNSGEVNPHRTWLTDDTRPVRASSISYYAPLVFESAGWIGRDAILMTGVNSISTSHAVPVPFFCR